MTLMKMIIPLIQMMKRFSKKSKILKDFGKRYIELVLKNLLNMVCSLRVINPKNSLNK